MVADIDGEVVKETVEVGVTDVDDESVEGCVGGVGFWEKWREKTIAQRT